MPIGSSSLFLHTMSQIVGRCQSRLYRRSLRKILTMGVAAFASDNFSQEVEGGLQTVSSFGKPLAG